MIITTLFLILCFHHPITTTTASQTTNRTTIISALVGAGDFSNWGDLLASADPVLIPFSATLFLPPNAAANTSRVNLLYHIVPQRLAFSDLRAYPSHTRLPTLAPGLTLLLTNTSLSNFSINHVHLTRPDLFLNAAVTAHAVAAPLDLHLMSVAAPTSSDQSVLRRRRRRGARRGRRRHPHVSEGPTAAAYEGSNKHKRHQNMVAVWIVSSLLILAIVLGFGACLHQFLSKILGVFH